MNAATLSQSDAPTAWLLRFESLFDEGRGYAFPCDGDGVVDLDTLTERARGNYFLVRTLVGRDFAMPKLQPTGSLH